MSFRCRGVNWIVFLTPSHHPHGSDHRGVPPPVSFGNCRKYWNGETISRPGRPHDRSPEVEGREEGQGCKGAAPHEAEPEGAAPTAIPQGTVEPDLHHDPD